MLVDSVPVLRAHVGTLTGIITVGSDANVQVCTAQFDDDARWQVGPRTSSSARPTLRSAAFSPALLMARRTPITMLGKTLPNSSTTSWPRLGLGTATWIVTSCLVNMYLLFATLGTYQSKSKCNDKFRSKPINWKPSNPRSEESGGLEHVSAAIAAAAKNAGFANSSRPPEADPELLAEVKDLDNLRRNTSHLNARKAIMNKLANRRRRVVREQHKWAAQNFGEQKAPGKWKRFSPTNTATELDGQRDRTKWSTSIGDHFASTFVKVSRERNLWAKRMQGDIDLHEYMFTFTADLLSTSLVSMQNGKTWASDFVVKEMLAHLDRLALEIMADFLGKRMRGQVDAPKSWKQLVSIRLPKKSPPSSTSHLRPICIPPVAKKLYLRVIFDPLRPHLQKMSSSIHGCRPHWQADEVSHTIRIAIGRAAEWNEDLVCAKLDIKAAFDSLAHPYIFSTLLNAGSPKDETYALAREYIEDTTSVFQYLNFASYPLQLLAGVRQGDCTSVAIFAYCLDKEFQPLSKQWKHRQWGYPIKQNSFNEVLGSGSGSQNGDAKPELLQHVAYADDLYIYATSPEKLENMLVSFTTRLQHKCLYIQPSKSMWTSTNHDHAHRDILIPGQRTPCSDPCTGFQALGSQVSFDRQLDVDTNVRICRAWKAFWTLPPMLTDRGVCLKLRFQILDMTIKPCILWGLST